MRRWPVIRHVRYWWHSYWLSRHLARCRRFGVDPYCFSLSDMEAVKHDVWDGKA